jgi:anti-anti-sigma factor
MSSRRPDTPQISTADDWAVSITDPDGTVIATIARHVEHVAAELDVDTVMSVVTVEGDIDLESAPLLERTLVTAIVGRQRTCLDLSLAHFLGAAGVEVLVTARQCAAGLGHTFFVRRVAGMPAQVLAICGLDDLIADGQPPSVRGPARHLR